MRVKYKMLRNCFSVKHRRVRVHARIRWLWVFALVVPLSLTRSDAQTLAAKNLRVLTPDVNIPQVMASFTAALGVQCNYCHVAGDFASDENPKKETARKMLRMLQKVSGHFPDSGNDFLHSKYLPFPEGKQYVTCFTCHRGSTTVAMAAPNAHGPDRAPEPGAPPPAPRPAGQAAAPRPAAAERADLPPGRGAEQHKNMVFLPSNADTFLVMPAFRAAIGVECNFCHVFGDHLDRGHADERDLDSNPKKLIARGMIGMLKEINTDLFPRDNVDIVFAASSIVPEGKRYVTCYSCHRGNHLPVTEVQVGGK
jgi:photosynthetic reaction center cytochrome c subunit